MQQVVLDRGRPDVELARLEPCFERVSAERA